jgi:hypothetical protein
LGTAFSILIRIELSGPGVQYISDNQLYNSIITAHAILMIFFMVKKQNTYIYNQINNFPFLYNFYYIKNKIIIENFSNNNNFTKIIIYNPFNNRDIILRITKNKKGVYL